MEKTKQLIYIAARRSGGEFLLLGRDKTQIGPHEQRDELLLPYLRTDEVVPGKVRSAVRSQSGVHLRCRLTGCSFRTIDGFGDPFPRIPFAELVVYGSCFSASRPQFYFFWLTRSDVDLIYRKGLYCISPEVMTYFDLSY